MTIVDILVSKYKTWRRSRKTKLAWARLTAKQREARRAALRKGSARRWEKVRGGPAPKGKKYCCHCETFKNLDQFYSDKGRPGSYCKPCHNENSRQRRKLRLEKKTG